MTLEQYKKFIDATLLAAACEFISEETAARHPKMQEDLKDILETYKFGKPDSEKKFTEMVLDTREKLHKLGRLDTRTKFLVRRFFNIAI